MEIFFTIITALIIFVAGQLCLEIIIKPIVNQKKLIEKVIGTVIFYNNVYYAGEIIKDEFKFEANKDTRKVATELKANYQIIPFYKFFEDIGLVKKKTILTEACRELIGLSNEVFHKSQAGGANLQRPNRVEKIEELLEIKISD